MLLRVLHQLGLGHRRAGREDLVQGRLLEAAQLPLRELDDLVRGFVVGRDRRRRVRGPGERVLGAVGEDPAVDVGLRDGEIAALREVEHRRAERVGPDVTPVHERVDDRGWIVGQLAEVLADVGRRRWLAAPAEPDEQEPERGHRSQQRREPLEDVARVALALLVGASFGARRLAAAAHCRSWMRIDGRRGTVVVGMIPGSARPEPRRDPRRTSPAAPTAPSSAPSPCRRARRRSAVRAPTRAAHLRPVAPRARRPRGRSWDGPRRPTSSRARRRPARPRPRARRCTRCRTCAARPSHRRTTGGCTAHPTETSGLPCSVTETSVMMYGPSGIGRVPYVNDR